MSDDDDDRQYHVVINDEEQYSIWFVGRGIPTGWREVGTSGSRRECLAYIDAIWKDIRPKSVRERL